ncbi:gliding motility-associated C-terminal domain-containing protein, partial [Aquimarina hainanensis]
NALDCDEDGVTNGQEITDGTDPTDGCSLVAANQDVTPSAAWNALDCDEDGVTNGQEITDGTDPIDPDTDGDGVTDGDEKTDGTDGLDNCDYNGASVTLVPDANWETLDCDGDGENNGEEVTNGTDPQDACSVSNQVIPDMSSSTYDVWAMSDCDGDGVINGVEVDPDGDGVAGPENTNPFDGCDYNADDQDISIVSDEWNALDCDEDGVTNEDEVTNGTDAVKKDTDGDGVTDGDEVKDGTDGLSPCDYNGSSITLPQTVDVSSLGCEGDVTIHTGISPNGDGVNDELRIEGLEKYPNNTLRIYNRWGVMVFEASGYEQSGTAYFTGTSNGRVTIQGSKKLPVGTYYYVLNYVDSDGVNQSKTGYLYINR